MTIAERVQDFLDEHRPKAFCDDCIARRLRLMLRQQVQRVTVALEADGSFQRVDGICSLCGIEKKVINGA